MRDFRQSSAKASDRGRQGGCDNAVSSTSDQDWVAWAIARINADYARSADTHLIPVELPALPDIAIYFKDESSHPTGSLKHRLARSLFLHALCSGWINARTTIVEASSGSTAVSEAYFARMLKLPFVAVVPARTSREKLDMIEKLGGRCHLVDNPTDVYDVSEQLAADVGGHYMDQFTFAERATDWRGNNNIAESIFEQLRLEPHPIPRWIVCGAGTGGTSATLGRFVRYHGHASKICLADPEGSVFHRHWSDPGTTLFDGHCSLIEGIGRLRVEPSFVPAVVDRTEIVSDAASIAAARVLSRRLGRRVGGSTGTNLIACARLATQMAQGGEGGAIVSILCDSGDRYQSTLFDDGWLKDNTIDTRQDEDAISAFFSTGSYCP